MQEIERAALAFQLRDAPRGQKTDVQFLAPAAQVDVRRNTAARRESKAEQPPGHAIGQLQVGAQIGVNGVDARQKRRDLPEERADGPMAEDAGVQEQHARRRVTHAVSSPRSSRCRTGRGATAARPLTDSAGR